MAIERTYIIPLRRELLKVPRYRRTKKAVIGIREFLKRHMKSDDIKIGEKLNLELWKNGIKNPPHKVKVTVIKDDDGTVKAELFGHKYVAKKKPEKVEKKTGIAGKLQDALGTDKKEDEDKTEEKKIEKPGQKEEKKPEARKEIPKSDEKKEESKKETKSAKPAPSKEANKPKTSAKK